MLWGSCGNALFYRADICLRRLSGADRRLLRLHLRRPLHLHLWGSDAARRFVRTGIVVLERGAGIGDLGLKLAEPRGNLSDLLIGDAYDGF